MIMLIVTVFGIIAVIAAAGTGLAWVTGLFGPIGYMGVPPWRVPECTCRNGKRAFMHETRCQITERAPR
jgi:hypothetical protein